MPRTLGNAVPYDGCLQEVVQEQESETQQAVQMPGHDGRQAELDSALRASPRTTLKQVEARSGTQERRGGVGGGRDSGA